MVAIGCVVISLALERSGGQLGAFTTGARVLPGSLFARLMRLLSPASMALYVGVRVVRSRREAAFRLPTRRCAPGEASKARGCPKLLPLGCPLHAAPLPSAAQQTHGGEDCGAVPRVVHEEQAQPRRYTYHGFCTARFQRQVFGAAGVLQR